MRIGCRVEIVFRLLLGHFFNPGLKREAAASSSESSILYLPEAVHRPSNFSRIENKGLPRRNRVPASPVVVNLIPEKTAYHGKSESAPVEMALFFRLGDKPSATEANPNKPKALRKIGFVLQNRSARFASPAARKSGFVFSSAVLPRPATPNPADSSANPCFSVNIEVHLNVSL